MGLSQRMEFCPWLLHFSKHLICNTPIDQIYIFILFVSASILFEGVFFLWITSKNYMPLPVKVPVLNSSVSWLELPRDSLVKI